MTDRVSGSITVDDALAAPVDQVSALLLSCDEDQWFDRKSARVAGKDLARVITAFANAEGGVVVIGLHDGLVEDVTDHVDRQNAWRLAAVSLVDPPARVEARILACQTREGRPAQLMTLAIESSETVHQTVGGECYLRVGDTCQHLSFQQRMELEFDKGQSQYDARPLPALSPDDLDATAVNEYRDAVGGTGAAEVLLRARGLLTRRGQVTNAAFLLFGDYPQHVFPEAYVRILRFVGTVRGTGAQLNLDDDGDRRVEGRIPEVVRRAADEIERRMPRRRQLASSGRFEGNEVIPRDAWLEGLVNAVIHRSYSLAGDHIRVEIYDDRIEIESPGRFPGLARLDDPMKISRFARNPHLARACSDLRIGQELGEGVKRIYQQMRERGFTDPSYFQSAGSVRLTLSATRRIDPETSRSLPAGAIALLRTMQRFGYAMSTGEAQELAAVSRPTALRYLRALERSGLVAWSGQSVTDPQARWQPL